MRSGDGLQTPDIPPPPRHIYPPLGIALNLKLCPHRALRPPPPEAPSLAPRPSLAFTTRYSFTPKLACTIRQSSLYYPLHLHCSHYCNTIVRLIRNIRPPSAPPLVFAIYHTILAVWQYRVKAKSFPEGAEPSTTPLQRRVVILQPQA